MKKIVSAGEILVEIMADRIGQSFLRPGPLTGPFPSGAPAIFISQAARLGQPAGLIASVGDDDFGALNIERLRSDGADVSAVSVHPGLATGSAFVTYAEDGSRHFVFNLRHSAAGALELGPAATALIEGADHVHVMGSSLVSPAVVGALKEATRAVKARGGTVSFDPNIRREMMGDPAMRAALDAVLAETDLFLPSGAELFLFTAAGEEKSAVRELLDRGVRAVVVKKGADGAVHHDRNGATASRGFAVEEVDPTGAGDCFGAAFVCAWLRGMPVARALALANACGALAVTVRGPMEGAPTLVEAEAFLAAHGEISSREDS